MASTDVFLDMQQSYYQSRRIAPKFEKLFGIKFGPYWNMITGFDIVKFDDFVKPRKRESLRAAILRKYGQEGVDMIKTLIGGKTC